MATKTKTENIIDPDSIRAAHIAATWAANVNGDDGAPFTSGGFRYLIFGVTGTFGAGGTIILEGSNNGGTTYTTCLDKAGAAVSLTAAGQRIIDTPYEIVRPRVTAGDGTTSLTPFLAGYR